MRQRKLSLKAEQTQAHKGHAVEYDYSDEDFQKAKQ